MRGFSFSSVILSYFLVGGGLFTGLLVLGMLHISGDVPQYGMLVAGGFVGGFIAARASQGSTILEPAIGAVGVVATIVAMGATSDLGRELWHVAQGETMKFVGLVGLCAAGGAIGGAFVSEKVHGDATTSPLPWVLYTAFATFGACMLATLIGAFLFAKTTPEATVDNADSLAKMVLLGLVIGCFLAGIVCGAQARIRILFASLVGGALGVAGLGLLAAGTGPGPNDKAAEGLAVLAVGGAIVTLIGSAIGWGAIGKRNAG